MATKKVTIFEIVTFDFEWAQLGTIKDTPIRS